MASRRAAAAAAATNSDFVAFSELQTTPEDVRVGDIEFDMHYQRRAKINTKLYEEYADLWRDGVDLASREPMIIARLADQGGRLVVIDAWHRAKGLVQAFGRDHVHRFDVALCTAEQAYIASYGANPAHGYARTNEDKRAITDDALLNFTNRSDGVIAKWCAVTVRYVGLRRAALEKEGKIGKSEVRIGLNNKAMTTTEIGAKKQPDPASVVEVGAPAPSRIEIKTDPRSLSTNGKFVAPDGDSAAAPAEPQPLIDPAQQPNFTPAKLPGGGFDQVMLMGGVTIMLIDNKTFSVSDGSTQIDIPALQAYLYLKAYADKIS